jgi:CheY-like chemotaxis protein
VDDNQTNRNILQTQLELWKFVPVLAGSGEEALQIMKARGPFDLVITDMQMPGMDGVSMARSMQAAYPDVPIILVSSLGDERKEEYKELFSSILTKPIKQHILNSHVINSLRKQRKSSTKENTVPPAEQKISSGIAQASPLSILIAEDNVVNQKIIMHMLTKMGYGADIVQNGQEAVDAACRKGYDIVLMDVQMPEMDGLEATRLIRKGDCSQPFIIAMTANAMQGDREECIVAGMDDYISKPINLNDLKLILEKFYLEKKDIDQLNS